MTWGYSVNAKEAKSNEQFFDYFQKTKQVVPDQRQGQWAYNLLREYRPLLHAHIAGREEDPFYDDKKMNIFLGYVAQHWDEFDN